MGPACQDPWPQMISIFFSGTLDVSKGASLGNEQLCAAVKHLLAGGYV